MERRKGEKRDYRAEYQARIERAKEAGFSYTQARGHRKYKTVVEKSGQKKRIYLERSIKTEKLREKINADRAKFFGGELPKRQRGESPFSYQDRLESLRESAEDSDQELEVEPPEYDWESFEDFRDAMLDLGLTEHELHDLWFGY